MSKKTNHGTKEALELSLIPAVLASSCCLTIPGLSLIGFSFAEKFLSVPDWILRILALVVLILSVCIYLYAKDIKNIAMIKQHKKYVIMLFVQTLLFALMIYLISLYLLVPVLCDITGVTMCSS